jgi:copper chaperone
MKMTIGATTMTTAIYHVTGMTCEHCSKAVSAELRALDGVSEVTVDLVPGGASAVTVVSAAPVATEAVETALDEAGDYRLGSPGEPPASAGPGGRLLPVVG